MHAEEAFVQLGSQAAQHEEAQSPTFIAHWRSVASCFWHYSDRTHTTASTILNLLRYYPQSRRQAKSPDSFGPRPLPTALVLFWGTQDHVPREVVGSRNWFNLDVVPLILVGRFLALKPHKEAAGGMTGQPSTLEALRSH